VLGKGTLWHAVERNLLWDHVGWAASWLALLNWLQREALLSLAGDDLVTAGGACGASVALLGAGAVVGAAVLALEGVHQIGDGLVLLVGATLNWGRLAVLPVMPPLAL